MAQVPWRLAIGTCALIQVSCYIEEFIFKLLPGFHYHWTVALVELLLFTGMGRCAQGRSPPSRVGPILQYAGVGGSLALGTGLGKVAFKYVNYATGTVLKSMKLLPVLALSACWLRRKYSAQEVVAALLMVCSAALFGLGERELEPSFHPLGFALSFACLLAQAVQSNLQDRLLRDYQCDVHESMLWSNGFGAVCVLVITLATGELPYAFGYFYGSPFAALLLLLRSVTFYAGALLYTMLLQHSGAVTAVAVSECHATRSAYTRAIPLHLLPHTLLRPRLRRRRLHNMQFEHALSACSLSMHYQHALSACTIGMHYQHHYHHPLSACTISMHYQHALSACTISITISMHYRHAPSACTIGMHHQHAH